MHQRGHLNSAARLYQEILAREEGQADALHLLRVLHFQQGEHHRAVEEIGRAIAARPNISAFHSNLTEAYRAQGKYERAVGCCRIPLRETVRASPNGNTFSVARYGRRWIRS
ncbi:MAG: tetratricopeptide repeat protein [Thermoguttaceae bacterium]